MSNRRNFNGYVEPIPQDYAALNRGDMLVPIGTNFHPMRIMQAAATLQPVPGAMRVHSIPVNYNALKNQQSGVILP